MKPNYRPAGSHAPAQVHRTVYWTNGRRRQHYLSGAVSMTPEGLNTDRLQAMATCEHVQPNADSGQRGPWGYKLGRGGYPRAMKVRGKRRGYKRGLRPAVVARHQQGRRR